MSLTKPILCPMMLSREARMEIWASTYSNNNKEVLHHQEYCDAIDNGNCRYVDSNLMFCCLSNLFNVTLKLGFLSFILSLKKFEFIQLTCILERIQGNVCSAIRLEHVATDAHGWRLLVVALHSWVIPT